MAARRPPKNQLAEVLESGLPEGCNSLVDFLHQYTVDQLTGTTQSATDNELATARKLARSAGEDKPGNPFPLIALQWPELVVTDPVEIPYFLERPPPDRTELLTQDLLDTIFEPTNPVLRMDWWQRLILAALFDPTIGQVFIKGCTGAGKGASIGIGFSLLFDVYNEESRLVLTGRDYSHGVENIFGEVKNWFLRMSHPVPASVLGESIDDTERHYINVKNPAPSSSTAGEKFSGAHSENTIYAFDESATHPALFFQNAEKNARKIAALSNPRTRFGRFYDAFSPLGENIDRMGIVRGGTRGNRLCVTVAGMDCMNVRHGRLKDPVAPVGGIKIEDRQYAAGDKIPSRDFRKVSVLVKGQIDLAQYRGIMASSEFEQIVFGHARFPKEDAEKQLILASWLDEHERAYDQANPPEVQAFGLDVAMSEKGDESCLAAGGEKGLAGLHRWRFADTMETLAYVLRVVADVYRIDLRQGRHPITVDADGCGKGTADRLKEMGVWVRLFNGGTAAEFDPQLYANKRAEAYALLGRRLNPADMWRGQPWAMPHDGRLREELCAVERVYKLGDVTRFKVTPKTRNPGTPEVEHTLTLRDKLHRSPDSGDAVAYLFHGLFYLHGWVDWLRKASAPLIVFPAPAPAEGQGQGESASSYSPPANGQPANGQPSPPAPENPNYAYLREQYGRLVGRDVGSVPMPKFSPGQAQQPQVVPQPPPLAQPAKKDDWLSRVKWGDE